MGEIFWWAEGSKMKRAPFVESALWFYIDGDVELSSNDFLLLDLRQ